LRNFTGDRKSVFLTPRRRDARAQRKIYKKYFAALRLCALALIIFSFPAAAQKLAVLTPEKSGRSEAFAERLSASLAARFKVLDPSLAEAAFLSSNPEKPFNLSEGEAKIIGAAIGCDFFLIVRAENQRRNSFEKKDYFEAYAALYVVSTRTGRLVFWKLATFSGVQPDAAEKLLFDSTSDLAGEMSEKLSGLLKTEMREKLPALEEIPEEGAPGAKDFRPPLPYKRISPPYTTLANLYKITATVDIEVDFDADGHVLRTEIIRWAGFGLDESVTETVRKMNWRPATRNGKALPIRALLRYNFKKIDKEE
jgi:hypothetical protein